LIRDNPTAAKPLEGIILGIEGLSKSAGLTLNSLPAGKTGEEKVYEGVHGKEATRKVFGNNAPKSRLTGRDGNRNDEYNMDEDPFYWGH
jgi:hypothetical protein